MPCHAGRTGVSFLLGQSEGILERINEPPWGDVYRGLLMHAGLLLLLLFVVVGVAGLTSSRALDSTVTLLRPNGDASMGLGYQAMR